MTVDPKNRSRWVPLGALLLLVATIAIQIREYLGIKEVINKRRQHAERRFEGEPERISRETQQNLRQWPAKITVVSSEVRAYLGRSPQENAKQGQRGMAAPFILCSLVKRYAQSSSMEKVQPVEKFKVEWSVEVEGFSGISSWLAYNRKDQTLFEVTFGPGGGRGTKFTGVTDKLLFQLDKEASQSQTTTINLRRLTKFGCKARGLLE